MLTGGQLCLASDLRSGACTCRSVSVFEADHLYLDYVGRDTFYGFLASQRGKLFRDEEFAELYCPNNGRASVPPSCLWHVCDLLATALLLQTHDRVSDAEAKRRADFDLCWKVALGIGIQERPFATRTEQCLEEHLAALSGPSGVARQGQGRLPDESGVCPTDGVHEETQDQGSSGYQPHPGQDRGEGHLQPVGPRDRQAGESLGLGSRRSCPERSRREAQGVGERAGPVGLLWEQPQGASQHRLG